MTGECALKREAAPIVGDFEGDDVSLLGRAHHDRSLAVFAGAHANVGGLDAVVDRVSHELHDGDAHRLEHSTIERQLGADDRQRRFFAVGATLIADAAMKRLEHVAEREAQALGNIRTREEALASVRRATRPPRDTPRDDPAE